MAPSALGCILLAQACCFALAKQLADIYWNSTNPNCHNIAFFVCNVQTGFTSSSMPTSIGRYVEDVVGDGMSQSAD
ncbi:hypothetical protein T02_10314 [Trichinella nativa]|uniref:Secreted protein n=1 Tax=Trichinella nativa TaxID=6335 RepID=A0A0V1LS93_9BILA|nr:hypothetical protein T06_14580 [Trichinella sp. T6]KRZ62365.1 hypothetical protein T02_10314 [Trichinella nativa]